MPSRLRRSALSLVFMASVFTAGWASAQDGGVWIQVEARSSLDLGMARAAAFAGTFTETHGFTLPSGWHAVVLGPYSADQAAEIMASLKRQGMIPSDSYVTDGQEFRGQFWPQGGARAELGVSPIVDAPVAESLLDDPLALALAAAGEGAAEGLVASEPGLALDPTPAPTLEPAVIDETPAEARASEALLTEGDRKDLQLSLQWFGFYNGAIDGAYGAGTRNSMAAWQAATGLEPTGILTARQRETLTGKHRDEVASYGFVPVEEQESGIDVTLPLSLVSFERYAPPFVQFKPKDGSGLRLMLISQPGDAGSLAGLYEVLQGLADVPATGPRQLGEKGFSLRGESGTQVAQASVSLQNGLIKGWLLLSTPDQAGRDARVVEVMENSFRAVGDTALDPGLVPLDEAAKRGLIEGLDSRKPLYSRSGVYVSAAGDVLTTQAAVASCGRITLDHTTEAQLRAVDQASGLALLQPMTALAPQVVASFRSEGLARGAELVVAGYPYEDRLPAPVLSYGTLEDLSGLEGEAGVLRLAAKLKLGDAGGPVLDQSGAVVGLLQGAPELAGKVLPDGLAYASDVGVIAQMLATAGLAIIPATTSAALPPESLTRQARGMTVLVSCWE